MKITMEVSHLPQLVKVQKESLKETVEFERSYTPHNRVETEREIPKLKFMLKQSVETAVYEI